ncbi:MAG: hypothetical protein H0T56_06465 [Pseudaminobacter sp.]|nr:hypothetical protein [Pseudaminobacter sp.]
MVAETQRLENAARLAMGEFMPPEPSQRNERRLIPGIVVTGTLVLTSAALIGVISLLL